jgi:hypothetical protein
MIPPGKIGMTTIAKMRGGQQIYSTGDATYNADGHKSTGVTEQSTYALLGAQNQEKDLHFLDLKGDGVVLGTI